MGLFMFVVGVLQIVGGLFVFFGAASAVHEILATQLIGFGFLSLGIGAMIERLDKR